MQFQIQSLLFDVGGSAFLGGPSVPVAAVATGVLGGGFTANWLASAGATGYFLDVSTSPVFASFVAGFNNLNVGNVLSYQILGLTGGTTYYYRVRANGPTGNSNVISQVTNMIAWTPVAQSVNWTDSGGAHSGNLATFLASPNILTTTIFNTTGAALTTLTDVSALPLLANLSVAGLDGTLDLSGIVNLPTFQLLTGTGLCPSLTSSTLKTANTSFIVTLSNNLTSISLPLLNSVGVLTITGNVNVGFTTLSLPSLVTASGAITLTGNTKLATISMPALVTAGGNISAQTLAALLSFDLSSLTTVTGNIDLTNDSVLNVLGMASLVSVGGNLAVQNLSKLPGWSTPLLQSVGGNFLVTSLAATAGGSRTINLSALLTIGGNFNFRSSTTVSLILMPLLSSVGSFGDIRNMDSLPSLSAPSLSTCAGIFDVRAFTTATTTSLNFPALTTVSGVFNLLTLGGGFSSVSFPSLSSVGGMTVSSLNAAVTSLSFPALTTCGAGNICQVATSTGLITLSLPNMVTCQAVTMNGNTALNNLSFGAWVPKIGAYTFTWNSDALPTARVDSILAALVAVGPTLTTATINLAGGTNGAPTNPLGDKLTLQTQGNTVLTN